MKRLVFLFLILSLSGCAVNPVTGKQDFVVLSEEQEIQMGREYNAQILRQYQIYEDEKIQNYVQSIGESLAKKSHRPNLIYRFTVLDSPEINAFALPGGYIYINRGLMAYMSSEEELAAVLGHEIGHVTARHSVRQYSQAQLMGVLSAAIEINSGRTAGDLANLASGALLSGYGREMELEADDLGAQYIYQDGYSPQGMYDVLAVLKDQEIYSKKVAKQRGIEPRNYHGVFASHPSNDKRLQEILDNVSQNFVKGTNKSKSNYLAMIEGMVFGDSQQAGVTRGNEFFHGPLNLYLSSPENWEIINNANSLVFKAPFGEATLKVTLEDLNFVESPEEYLKRFVRNTTDEEVLMIDGLSGFTAKTYRSGRTTRMAVIFKDDKAYQFIAYLKDRDGDFSSYDLQFMNIIKSLRSLTEKELKYSQPLRIKTYKVRQGETYESIASTSSITLNPEDQLRLLNGDYPDKELTVGRVIKIVD